MDRTRRLLLPALLGALTVLVAGCGAAASGSSDGTTSNGVATVPTQAAGAHGDPLVPAKALPALIFTDTSGKPFALRSEPSKGLFLLFFGYTRCPDVCPTTMADVAAALDQLPASVRDRVTVGFISVDPAYDTPQRIRLWLNHFSTSFIGLSGSSAQVGKAQRAVGLPVLPGKAQVTNHAAELLVFGKDKTAHYAYTAGQSAADYEADLPVLVHKYGS